MFNLTKSKNSSKIQNQTNCSIEKAVEELTDILTQFCYNKETCTRKLKKKNKGCLLFCKRIAEV